VTERLSVFIPMGLGFPFALAGWVLFTASLGTWRIASIKIDTQIVLLYTRYLELERQLNMEIQTRYFFNHLTDDTKRELSKSMNQCLDKSVKEWTYEEFKTASQGNNPLNPNQFYDELLGVWRTRGRRCVTSRGHGELNLVAFLGSLSVLVAILVLNFQGNLNPIP
jgi:hypothetical protein